MGASVSLRLSSSTQNGIEPENLTYFRMHQRRCGGSIRCGIPTETLLGALPPDTDRCLAPSESGGCSTQSQHNNHQGDSGSFATRHRASPNPRRSRPPPVHHPRSRGRGRYQPQARASTATGDAAACLSRHIDAIKEF